MGLIRTRRRTQSTSDGSLVSRRALVKSERYLPTYFLLRGASWSALKGAKASEDGRFFNLLYAMVFSAFCLEAFINHLGKLKHPNWRKLRKKLQSPKTKLN